MLVDAAQVTAPERDAVAVEKFENLDGDLAAAADTIAKLGGGELAVGSRCREVADDFDHRAQGCAQKIMIVSDFVHPAHPRREFEEPTNFLFRRSEHPGNVAHAGR